MYLADKQAFTKARLVELFAAEDRLAGRPAAATMFGLIAGGHQPVLFAFNDLRHVEGSHIVNAAVGAGLNALRSEETVGPIADSVPPIITAGDHDVPYIVALKNTWRLAAHRAAKLVWKTQYGTVVYELLKVWSADK